MSGDIYPTAKALLPGILRSAGSIVLILIALACVYLSLAAREAPRDVWWKFWTVYGVVGCSCLLGAGWLLRRSTGAVALNLIVVGCLYLSLVVLGAPREDSWTYWTICAFVWTSCAIVGLCSFLWMGWLLRAK